MADKQTTIPFYDQYGNKGFGEFGYNFEDLVGSANFTNQKTLPNNGLLNITGGGSYQPFADNTVNPRAAINYQDPSGLNIKALMDEYRKTAGAEYGPAFANITDTGKDVIKKLGLQGQNFGANITDSNKGTELGVNAIFNMLGGQANLSGYKNPEDKGIFGNIEWKFK
tara:strand:- start:978 stop:1481 length:504 start_codon:yes stop_codon:yes gene_type:complete